MPSPDAPPPTSEIVHRAEPGLARGVWEAPAGAFYVALAAVLLLSLAYAAGRLGFWKRRPSSANERGSKRPP